MHSIKLRQQLETKCGQAEAHCLQREVILDNTLTEIEARLEATTPGDWHRFDNGFDGMICAGMDRDIGPDDPNNYYGAHGPMIVGGERHEGYIPFDSPNGIFIANAKKDIRTLLDRVKYLTDALMHPYNDPDYPILAGDMRSGLFCGVEDRELFDRYDCAEYGWEQLEERLQEWMQNLVSGVYV